MKFTYKHTRYACYLGYTTGAIINNFASILFVIFQRDFGVTLSQLSILIVANFGVQLIVDFLGTKYVDKIGSRNVFIVALGASFLGLLMLGILPFILPHFAGLMISVIVCAVGSGMLEVMVSPTIEALPGHKNAQNMSFLHSFYCWGTVLVVLGSTLFFKLFGLRNWNLLCFFWAMIPAITMLLFLKVPIIEFGTEREKGSLKKLLTNRLYLIFMVLMLCAGASEIAMSQWVSFFAQICLNLPKELGDILGPCLFAILMGICRVLYGKYSDKIGLYNGLLMASVICIIGYLTSVFSKNSIISLIGCGAVGFGSGIMWPATLSLAAMKCKYGGGAVFALLAMAGDIGCCVGPGVVGAVSMSVNLFDTPLKAGLLAVIAFPLTMILFVLAVKKIIK